MKKYELTEECKIIRDVMKVYRIKALIDFANAKKGDIGGFVESEGNLSHHGCAWVSGNALVSGKAKVSGNALVSGDALVSGKAKVSGDASVSGNALVSGDAWVSDNARVSGGAWVSDNAIVSGNALVSGKAIVSGNARVSGKATVSDNARVGGNVFLSGYANVGEKNSVSYGVLTRDISNNADVLASLLCGLNVIPKANKVTLYKRVNTDKKSGRMFDLHTGEFEYVVGKLAVCNNAVDGVESCAPGLHVSTPDYWNSGNTLIQCEVNVEDIITVQDGKVRCRKLKVIAVVE